MHPIFGNHFTLVQIEKWSRVLDFTASNMKFNQTLCLKLTCMVVFDSSWQKNEFVDTSGTNSKDQLLNVELLTSLFSCRLTEQLHF